jgi:hypothetical protein
LIAAYAGFVKWDIWRVETICRKIHPATSLDSARSIIKSYGLGSYLPDPKSSYPNGVMDERKGSWFFAVPAGTTMGDWTCGIWHDGARVLSTTMWEDEY